MSYDEQSQSFGDECIARPNSGLYDTAGGLMAYLKLGISADKLVLGLPWYGYDYTCVKTDRHNKCYIQEVPFRGVKCSDAAGRQVPYVDLKKLWDKYGYSYDEHSQTWYSYFNVSTLNH